MVCTQGTASGLSIQKSRWGIYVVKKKVKKVAKALRKASKLHAAQAKSLESVMKKKKVSRKKKK